MEICLQDIKDFISIDYVDKTIIENILNTIFIAQKAHLLKEPDYYSNHY